MVDLFASALAHAAMQVPFGPQPWSAGHIVTTLLLQSTTLCRSAEQCVAHVAPSPEPSPKLGASSPPPDEESSPPPLLAPPPSGPPPNPLPFDLVPQATAVATSAAAA